MLAFDREIVEQYPSAFANESRNVTVAALGTRLIAVVWTWREGKVIRRNRQGVRELARKENIVSYTADEIAAMRARGEDQTDWAKVDAKTEEQLAADTASDPAWDGIPEDWYKDAVVRSGALAPPRENKKAIHIRFDADILEFFERGGPGWQGRMNAVLRSFVERQPRCRLKLLEGALAPGGPKEE